jgi:hypothetical protein
MRRLVERIQGDPWWCPRVKTANTLRDKWADLVVRLCPGNLAGPSQQTIFNNEYYKNDSEAAAKAGFRI